MKNLLLFIVLLFPVLAIGQTESENYVKTTRYQVETTTGDVSSDKKLEIITYHDVLGRPKQQIQIGITGNYENDFNNSSNSNTRSSIVEGWQMDWTEGEGGTQFFNNISNANENLRLFGTAPNGKSELLWRAGNDSSADHEIGWATNDFTVDKTSKYIYTTWVKNSGNINDGKIYHTAWQVNNLDGSTNDKAYFFDGYLPESDTWYLLVGVIHPYNYKGVNTGLAGVYDIEGNKVVNGNELKWKADQTTTRMRNFYQPTVNSNSRAFFWSPEIQKIKNKPTSWESDWFAGVGGTAFFNKNGSESENFRTYGEAPNGEDELLWKCVNDSTNDADGGWNTDYIPVYKERSYRYTTWVKKTGNVSDGLTYHGIQLVNDLNGKEVNNPYFWQGTLPTTDDWYLLVGVVHPYDYNGGDTGQSGVYDINGNKVADGQEFIWRKESSKTQLRNYLYYATDVNTKQYFWNPQFELLSAENEDLALQIRAMLEAGGDIISHFEYDEFGRQSKSYLPYSTQISSGGEIYLNAKEEQLEFYSTDKYENTLNPYRETHFENSPLSRVLEVAGSGNDWILDANSDLDHTTKRSYTNNKASDNIRKFRVHYVGDNINSPDLVQDGFYLANDLTKIVIKDENWQPSSGKNHTIEQYRDEKNHLILRRTFNDDVPHDTYYIYNDFGNVSYIVTPEGVDVFNSNPSSTLNNYTYQYIYDRKARLIERKMPGVGWEYIVYNKLNLPVLIQDQNLRNLNKWVFIKYDAFGKMAYKGIASINQSRLWCQEQVDSNSQNFESRISNPIFIDNTEVYYSNTIFPSSEITEMHVINYYDDYNFNWNPNNEFNTHPSEIISFDQTLTTNTSNLITGSKIRILDSDQWIHEFISYDKFRRPIYATSYREGVKEEVFLNRDFQGLILNTKKVHYKVGFNIVEVKNNFSYDKTNRLIEITHQIDNQEEQVITKNNYDELGVLTRKDIGGTSNSSSLQQVDFKYNIRGWLTDINDVYDPEAGSFDLFNLKINYNELDYDRLLPKQYNGNVAQITWRTVNEDRNTKSYSFDYDDLNRMTRALFSTKDDISNSWLFERQLEESVNAYDKNGNILSLNRTGPSIQGEGKTEYWDFLTYTYEGNQLKSVTESQLQETRDYVPVPNEGFIDGNTVGDDYSYDANGNMLVDKNKGITSNIEYNYLNLPTRVNVDGANGGEILYTYTATGEKIEKRWRASGDQNYSTLSYINGLIYEKTPSGTESIKQITHQEGYVVADENNSFKYIYTYKEHLGNVRMSYSDVNGDGSIDQTEILQENNYYPFGLQHKGYNNNITLENLYKFNGVEHSQVFNTDLYEMSYRNYNPSIGRFMNFDPLANSPIQVDKSPYAFAWNNPLMFADPSGLCPDGCPDPEDYGDDDQYFNEQDNGFYVSRENAQGEREWELVPSLDEVVVTAPYEVNDSDEEDYDVYEAGLLGFDVFLDPFADRHEYTDKFVNIGIGATASSLSPFEHALHKERVLLEGKNTKTAKRKLLKLNKDIDKLGKVTKKLGVAGAVYNGGTLVVDAISGKEITTARAVDTTINVVLAVVAVSNPVTLGILAVYSLADLVVSYSTGKSIVEHGLDAVGANGVILNGN